MEKNEVEFTDTIERLKPISWLKDCEICNVGVCKQMDEYKAQGMSERAASRQMEKDCDGIWDADKIYGRYRYYKRGHYGGSVGKPHSQVPAAPDRRQRIVNIMQQVVCPTCEKEARSCKAMRDVWMNLNTYEQAMIKGILP